jgi:hypothetical protein
MIKVTPAAQQFVLFSLALMAAMRPHVCVKILEMYGN